MTTVFALLVHVVLFCAAIGQLILIAMLILDGFASKGAEGLMRSIAGSAGLLLILAPGRLAFRFRSCHSKQCRRLFRFQFGLVACCYLQWSVSSCHGL